MGYVEELRTLIGHKCIILNGSAVIIENNSGLILMQQRKYPYGKWSLPGGLMELGESTEETAIREIYEETSIQIKSLKLLGVYSGKNYYCSAANGDEWYVVTTTYITSEYEGEAIVNDTESISFEWINPINLPENTAKTHRIMINNYLSTK
jgi:8-oxo-dGTP pyrophosphatase MutT (NUDIX family)